MFIKLFKIIHILNLILYYQILDSNSCKFRLIYLMKTSKTESYQWRLTYYQDLKSIVYSNPFGMTFILKSNLSSSCKIRCAS